MTPAHLILTATICRDRAEAYRAFADHATTLHERVQWQHKAEMVERNQSIFVGWVIYMAGEVPAFLLFSRP